jgi:hypothetical protein
VPGEPELAATVRVAQLPPAVDKLVAHAFGPYVAEIRKIVPFDDAA